MILLYHRFYDIHPFSHLHLGPEVPPRIGPRKPCASASARCPESKLQKAPPHDSRSSPLGFPVAALARLAKAAHLRPTRDCHPVAQERISVVLEMEDRPRWPGRRRVPTEVRDLIRQMSQTNPLWGAPRIHGELLKLGIEVNQATVSKYMVRHRKPPPQSWRTFLTNHAKDIVSVDFFTVPTATFRVLFVFLVLTNERRRVLHFNVTDSPSAAWTGQQIVEAFPWDTTPTYLLRDRDGVFGEDFVRRVESLGIKQVLISARSPWQNPYVERLIGSIRRECVDQQAGFDGFGGVDQRPVENRGSRLPQEQRSRLRGG